MRFPARLATLFAAALFAVGQAAGQVRVADRLQFAVQWDDDYLYLGVITEDVDVVARQRGGNRPVWLDDDIELFIETDNGKGAGLTDRCFWLGLSASEAYLFRRGAAAGESGARWLPAEQLLLGQPIARFAVKVAGSLNDRADMDDGWSMEVALPWRALGRRPPQVNELWGFNLVRHLRGDQDARFSFVPQATPLATIEQPKEWGWLLFRGAQGEAGPAGVFVEPGEAFAVIGVRAEKPPLIDGRVNDEEWPQLYRQKVTMHPMSLLPVDPVAFPWPADRTPPLPEECDEPLREIAAPPSRGAWAGERIVAATYRMDYQADTRQPAHPPHGVRHTDGSSMLSVHPPDGLGPWFSALRVGWHREQLLAAGRAGVDLLLVRYHGDRASRRVWSDAALRSFAVAVTELNEQWGIRPEVGLLLPLESIFAEVGPGADFTQQVTQASCYRMIRDFFRALPPPVRGVLVDGPRQACVMAFDETPATLRVTPSLLAYCRARFREDFGVELLVVGATSWGRRRLPVDGSFGPTAGLGWLADGSGRFPSLSLGPGYDNLQAGDAKLLRGRDRTAALRGDLAAAMAARQRYGWLFLNSWNDFVVGDSLAECREYGNAYEAEASLAALRFNGTAEQPWVAKFRRADVPLTMASGSRVSCPLRVANGGVRPWQVADGVRIGYRWYPEEPTQVTNDRGEPVFDRRGLPVIEDRPLTTIGPHSELLLSPTHRVVDTSLPVEAVGPDLQPLAPGRYRLRLDAFAGYTVATPPLTGPDGQPLRDDAGRPVTDYQAHPNYFSLRGDDAFDIMVEVVEPDSLPVAAGTILALGLPPRVETGQVYPCRLRVRNDGRTAWGHGYRVAIRYELVEHGEPCQAEAPAEPVTDWLPVADLFDLNGQEPVGPGELLEARIEVPVTDAAGRPLNLRDSLRWDYQLNATVIAPSGQLLPGNQPHFHTVDLIRRDYGGSFTQLRVPPLMRPASEPLACQVEVLNTAFATWPAGTTQVAFSWYHWDGSELQFDAGRAPLPIDLASGQRSQVTVPIQPPAMSGKYLLAFDLVHADGQWNSRQPSTTAHDLRIAPVAVLDGRTVPLRLEPLLNVKAQSWDDARGAGDFDGTGRSFPAEELPPMANDPGDGLYPSGYQQASEGAPAWQRGIVFRYPNPTEREVTALIPSGQRVVVPADRYRRLHLLGAAIGEDTPGALAVETAAGRVDLPEAMLTRWDAPPRHSELVGFMTWHRHAAAGDEPDQPAWLHHLVVVLDPTVELRAVVLPDQPRWRIMAITLETAGGEPSGPPAP